MQPIDCLVEIHLQCKVLLERSRAVRQRNVAKGLGSYQSSYKRHHARGSRLAGVRNPEETYHGIYMLLLFSGPTLA